MKTAGLVIAVLLLSACGSKLDGTYSGGAGASGFTLSYSYTFRSNGTVLMSQSVMGTETEVELKYEVDGDKIKILGGAPAGATLVLTLLNDGSIQGPGGIKLTKQTQSSRGGPQSNLAKPEMAANQDSAVGSLRAINVACVAYASMSGIGDPSSLQDLGTSRDGLIDGELASGTKSGYVFTYSKTPGGYSVWARPTTYGSTGKRNYYTDQTGIIRFTEKDRQATGADALL